MSPSPRGIFGDPEDPRLSALFKQLRAAGPPRLQLDVGRGPGEYTSTRDLLAALLRSLVAREIAREAGRGSLFSLIPPISSRRRLREEVGRVLEAGPSPGGRSSRKALLQRLSAPGRSGLWARCAAFLEESKALDPSSSFRELVEGRLLYLRRDRAEAEKIFRRLAQSEESGIRYLARMDLVSLLLESRRFEEARAISSDPKIYGPHGRMPLRHAMASFLLGDSEGGLRSMALLKRKTRENLEALRELRVFLLNHRGPFARLLRRSRWLREELGRAAPRLFSASLAAELGKPVPMGASRLRGAIGMLEELRGGNLEAALSRLASFLDADLAVWCPLEGEPPRLRVGALAGEESFLAAARERIPVFSAAAAEPSHPTRAALREMRPVPRLFLEESERKGLLGFPRSRAQLLLPVRKGRGEPGGLLLFEAGYLLAPTSEELFFAEELARRWIPLPAAGEHAAAPVAPKGRSQPRLDSFPDFAKRRFGIPIDLRLSGRALRAILPDLAVAAGGHSPILLVGESGCGKEVLARYAHFESPLREGPFIAFNCNAVPSELVESELFGHVRGAFTGAERDRVGLFEVAQGGTLLLDEIGDLKPEVQGKLLRVLQEGTFRRVGEAKENRFGGRVIAATHRILQAAIQRGEFREDLFHRLNRFAFSIPPLRGRRDEILPLSRLLLRRFAEEEGREEVELLPEAEGWLWRQEWPGNVRALENFVYKLALFYPGERVGESEMVETAKKFDLVLAEKINPREATADLVRMALESAPPFDGRPNVSRAAQLLGWDRTTLKAKMDALGVD